MGGECDLGGMLVDRRSPAVIRRREVDPALSVREARVKGEIGGRWGFARVRQRAWVYVCDTSEFRMSEG